MRSANRRYAGSRRHALRFRDAVVLAVAVILSQLTMRPAAADYAGDVSRCFSEGDSKWTERAAACTQVIKSGRANRKDLSGAYNWRGECFRILHQYDRALEDYARAIEIDPQSVYPYTNRAEVHRLQGNYGNVVADAARAIQLDPGMNATYTIRALAYEKLGNSAAARADYNKALALPSKGGDGPWAKAVAHLALATHDGTYDRALAAYTEAMQSEPKRALWVRYRGYANFVTGNFGAAAEDLKRANDLQEDAYPMLWRFLARSRLGQDAAGDLDAGAARLKEKNWPYPVIDFYLGRATLADVQAAAITVDDKCEAEFYIGEWNLLRGRMDAARESLRLAADMCWKGAAEGAAAIAEIKRIKS
jgi:lipoprotein NlpI